MRLQNPNLDISYTALVYLIAGGLLLPFALYHVANRHWVMAVNVGGCALAFFGLSAWLFRHGRAAPLLNAVVLVVAIVAALTAIRELQFVGAYWSYPLVLVFYLLYSLRVAAVINLAFILLSIPVLWQVAPPEYVARFVSSLALTSCFTFLFADNLQRSKRKLERLALVDPLSGAGNRRQMEGKLDEGVYLYHRYAIPFSLIVTDIDHFKQINDIHGHLIGDEILVQLAGVFRDNLRRSDRVFRYGGEEFVIYLPSTGIDAARHIAQKLREQVASTNFPGVDQLTVSAGVAELERGEAQLDWLRRADAALYRAKEAGRNRVNVATSETTYPPEAAGGRAT